ncbi:MAG: hypothetical protein KDJ15_02555 [Alphaproteobacteria bacterium]|nr:hypothetical protein [Alphaproteobacteria bacterium]
MKLFVSVLVFCLLASPAFAGNAACYTAAEAEAEQGIRIHSELMVIGLNCQGMQTRGKNLYAQYREFSAAHGDLFAAYEDRLLGYFRKRGDADPEASLNTLRTAFANKISLDAAKMRPDLFCNHYGSRIPKVAGMDRATLRKWASTVYPGHPVSQPLCAR